ncbi:TPA: hypothetical protein EYN98_30440 [Candidatus Poribacteria bacterium]|nr:hypothetical protein [Candidatus Poribacteria bacterium]HIA70288.1 hypothetical protein [Candidatus Poribacteria bacterium]HIB92238.1 hypothetical protein [Candidatus Poribacteria bacterium]HIC00794.1 hypothetical protein [Candidatus Poribacteria bacterium]HIC19831.1 hypothetical protein [Candidatus Poribacteria bacterium]
MKNTENKYGKWLIWLIYIVLLAVGVPWYWDSGDKTIWFGFPAWVMVAIIVSLILSCLTAWLLQRPWSETPEENNNQ